jgi:hypothetical protein
MCVGSLVHCPADISTREACFALKKIAWHLARSLCTWTVPCCPLLGVTDFLREKHTQTLILPPPCFTIEKMYIRPFAVRACRIGSKHILLRLITPETVWPLLGCQIAMFRANFSQAFWFYRKIIGFTAGFRSAYAYGQLALIPHFGVNIILSIFVRTTILEPN